jgi:hypothetical protein
MQTVEIRSDKWSHALSEWNAVHDGWLVSVDVLSPELGAQLEIRDLPLIGVVAEPQNGGNVTIAAGTQGGGQITHMVQSPARIWLERADNGADVALQIESADGTKTIVRFKTPALPETVDGVPRR